MPTVQIPSLGSFTGIEKNGVHQYKNVPFGIYEKRFTPAKLAGFVGARDCTQQGPMCPQDVPYSDSYLGAADPIQFEYKVSEFECLNLMITAPAVVTHPLPVVVWIHGGSNCMGTAYRGVNDPSSWVKHSNIIVVTLQFRVGLFGFLPFEGLGNLGLMDQHLGIEWVYQYISHWGGDPLRLSLFGQSSGSACAYLQTCRSDRRFKRAAFFSGSLRSLRCRTLEEYTRLTTKICSILDCEPGDLQTLPWQSLVDAFGKTGVNVLSAVDDGHFLPLGGYHEPPPLPLEAAVFSDCHQDGWFFKDGLPPGALYPLVPGCSSDLEACRLLTDYIFFAGNYATCQALRAQGTRVFFQCFDAVNPLTPELGNNHMVELFYGLGAYELPPQHRALAKKVQEAWARFARFKDPWTNVVHVTTDIEEVPWEQLGKIRDMSVLDKEIEAGELITGW